ncbi:DNA endonuclease [Bacillus phage vB_BceH_LY2]|nr:DNA endonuclease [Bacillus phage vB_BceH_LY2]
MEQEIWKSLKDIVECGDTYSVSNLGRVRNDTTYLVRKQSVDKDGYLSIGLYNKGKGKTYKVHRLVAISFIHNPENKPQVNHINGNKQDNKSNNLEWATSSENVRHSIDIGLKKHYKGEKHNRSSLTNEDVKCIKKLLIDEYSLTDIASRYNVNRQTIGNIRNGKHGATLN